MSYESEHRDRAKLQSISLSATSGYPASTKPAMINALGGQV
nr:hypothetical protein [Kibdelosporangium sp. MJ126-NF4]CEL21650.1 hypothetical protein [Kibdelosporangium sp. MJ126-NF4]CTQ92431.1 hypothetical protein [Kibdelosporangium sp. MJ126-NF4]